MKNNLMTKLLLSGLVCCSALQAATDTSATPSSDTSSQMKVKEKCTLNTGFSFAAFGGANWAHTHVSLGDVEFDVGYIVGGSTGYRWKCGLEVEAEVAYRRNHMDRFKFDRTNFHASGHLRKWTYMGNLKYYFPVHWYITPNIGAGAGYGNQKLFINSINGISIGSHQKKEGFAWQVLAGLTCYLCRHLDLDLDYHYTVLKGRTHDNSFSAALTASF